MSGHTHFGSNELFSARASGHRAQRLTRDARSQESRRLPERPDLGQLKRQAKELLEAFLAGEKNAVAEVNRFYRDADAAEVRVA